jgi:hypothetical protein
MHGTRDLNSYNEIMTQWGLAWDIRHKSIGMVKARITLLLSIGAWHGTEAGQAEADCSYSPFGRNRVD